MRYKPLALELLLQLQQIVGNQAVLRLIRATQESDKPIKSTELNEASNEGISIAVDTEETNPFQVQNDIQPYEEVSRTDVQKLDVAAAKSQDGDEIDEQRPDDDHMALKNDTQNKAEYEPEFKSTSDERERMNENEGRPPRQIAWWRRICKWLDWRFATCKFSSRKKRTATNK